MRQLREVREWREEFGMGLAGGPVRVAGSAPQAAEPEEEPPVAEPDAADVRVHLDFDEPGG